MTRFLKSFQVCSGSRVFDYRLGEGLNLDKVKAFFQKNYDVKKLWHGTRHILGIVTKNNLKYFLKLSTSEGISIVTQNEYHWNDYFNGYDLANNPYVVPKNHNSGYFEKKYFYLITDYFDGELLSSFGSAQEKSLVSNHIPSIIELSETIQNLPQVDFSKPHHQGRDYKERFYNKAKSWYGDIPENISEKYKVYALLEMTENGVDKLSSKPRHGDFTPWHIFKLSDRKLGLIDGEHAQPDGCENYDICYFIQRTFSVLKNPQLAKNIYSRLLVKGYSAKKLKAVLAARAIGGYLDESLATLPKYEYAASFQDWIVNL